MEAIQMICNFFVPGVPVTQGSMKAFMPKGARFPVVTHDKREPLKNWRATVALAARRAADDMAIIVPLRDDAIKVKVQFLLPRPKGHYGTRGLLPSAPRFPVKKPDLDKLTRAIGDALKGIIYADDSQVVNFDVCKRFAPAPGAAIQIMVLTDSE